MTLPPKAQAVIVSPDGKPTREFYDWVNGNFSELQAAIDSLATLVETISGIETNIDSLLDTKADKSLVVTGEGSIIRVGGSDLSEPVVFQLEGDQENPGLNAYYGTDGSGNKGFVPVSNFAVDTTGFVVVSGDTLQEAFASTDSALTDLAETGIRYGGVGTVDGGVGVGTTVSITAGAGVIMDITDPLNPVYHEVTWDAFATQSLDSTASVLTWWYIDSAGDLQQTTMEPTEIDYRDKIFLFRTGYTGGVISSLVSVVQPLQQLGPQVRDLALGLGPLIVSGCRPSPNGTNVKITRSSGLLLNWGANYATDEKDPHEVAVSLASPLSFRMITATGTPGSFITDLPVANYDNAGTVTAIPGSNNRASIFSLYQFASGNVLIQYDNTYYNSLSEARAALTNSRDFTVNPLVADAYGICIGYIIATKDCTDLSDTTKAAFFLTSKFGDLGGAGAANTTAAWGGITGSVLNQTDMVKLIGVPVTALTNSSGTVTIDCSLGDYFTLTLAANVTTISFTNLPTSGYAKAIAIRFLQNGTGGWTVTLPSSFKATGGSDTTVATAANAYTLLTAITFDQGTRWEYAMQEIA